MSGSDAPSLSPALRLLMRVLLAWEDEKSGGAIYFDDVVKQVKRARCVVQGVDFDLGAGDFSREQLWSIALTLAEEMDDSEEWTEDTLKI